jgi:hypothetical protein
VVAVAILDKARSVGAGVASLHVGSSWVGSVMVCESCGRIVDVARRGVEGSVVALEGSGSQPAALGACVREVVDRVALGCASVGSGRHSTSS